MALLRRRRAPEAPLEVGDATVVPIGSVVARRQVRVIGEVTRMRARPTSGQPSLAITVTDDTGTVTAVWTGRRAIGGITLGRRLLIEGVPLERKGQLEFTNPAYTLLQRH